LLINPGEADALEKEKNELQEFIENAKLKI
jgi:hypothetical protein